MSCYGVGGQAVSTIVFYGDGGWLTCIMAIHESDPGKHAGHPQNSGKDGSLPPPDHLQLTQC